MLCYAAKAGRLDVVKFLVSSDANINYRDYDHKTPLMMAKEEGHSEVR